jgi:hypothetical protein
MLHVSAENFLSKDHPHLSASSYCPATLGCVPPQNPSPHSPVIRLVPGVIGAGSCRVDVKVDLSLEILPLGYSVVQHRFGHGRAAGGQSRLRD